MEYLWIMLVAFGVYRVALMLTTEDGPFEIFFAWREINRIEYGSDNWFVRGIHCPLCVSFWLSLIAGFVFWDGLLEYVVYSFGIAGLAAFLILLAGIPGGE